MSASGTGTGRGRHGRDDVVAAALDLLDRVGLPDLTMRRVAGALGVQPSALYWHFDSKQALLAALADRIAADPETSRADGDPGAAAGRLRARLLAHRDGAEVVASTFALGLGNGAPLRRLTSAFAQAGLDDDVARAAGATLLHFVLGSVQHEQQRRQAEELGIAVAPEPPGDFDVGVRLIVRGALASAPAPGQPRVDGPGHVG